MATYSLSQEAKVDLQEIWLFIAAGNPRAADDWESEIYRSCELLATHPHIGHKREDVTRDDLRAWSIGNYCIFYQPDSTPLAIVRILSGYRDMGKLLQ